MELEKYIYILLFIAIASPSSSQQVSANDDDKPFLRIVAPQYICDTKSNKTEANDNKLTIGLQTREGQRLNYRIAIEFNILDGFKNQRHTLSIWKNVRELEAKFQNKNIADDITLKNQIEIDALELTPQVVYTFKVIGYDENKRASDEQNFTITYKGDKLKAVQSNIGDGVSLLLYGPETFYNDLEFLAVADVLFCDPINDYYFRWKINGLLASDDNEDYLTIKGSTLKLPSGIFTADTFYEVSVTVFNNKSQQLASLRLPIKVISKEFKVQNIPAECSVGVNRDVPFFASLYRTTLVDEMTIKWKCMYDNSECSNVFTNTTDSHQAAASFPTESIYELITEVSMKTLKKSSNTKVTADSKIIPHVLVKYFPNPISTMSSNEFVFTLMDLVPKCTAFWIIISDEKEFAKPKMDLTNLGNVSVKDYEEHFLQELVDYDNNTLSKDIKLTIPNDALYPNVMYKFRLNIVCPEPLTDLMTPTDRKNVTTFYDIIVSTNGPPETLALQISPHAGVAMMEKFTFKTGAAKDQGDDFPLKYVFGYKVENLIIIIGTFYEYQVAVTQLPYSNEISTFFEVSDNNNASIRVEGPKIAANLSYEYTKSEIDFKLSEIQGTLKRSEYSKTLNSAVTFILTQRKFASSDEAKSYEEKIYAMLKNELESLKSLKSSSYVYQQNVVEFVSMAKNLISIMTTYDDTFIENILSLTEGSNRPKRLILSNSLRNRGIMTNDQDYIKNVLSLSDMLMSSTNASVVQREKKHYVKKIHEFVTSLCYSKNLNSLVIESKFVIFEVSKIYSRQLSKEPQLFPQSSASILFSSNSAFPAKFLCVGKIKFSIDMFDDGVVAKNNSSVYETRVYDDNGNNEKFMIDGENIGEYAVVEMPIEGNSNEFSCAIWTQNEWNSFSCEKQTINTTAKISCKCKTSTDAVIVKYSKSSENKGDKNPSGGSKSTTTASSIEATLKFEDLTKSTSIIPSVTTESMNGNVDENKISTTDSIKSTTKSSQTDSNENDDNLKAKVTTEIQTTSQSSLNNDLTTNPTVNNNLITTMSSNLETSVSNIDSNGNKITTESTSNKITTESISNKITTESINTKITTNFYGESTLSDEKSTTQISTSTIESSIEKITTTKESSSTTTEQTDFGNLPNAIEITTANIISNEKDVNKRTTKTAATTDNPFLKVTSDDSISSVTPKSNGNEELSTEKEMSKEKIGSNKSANISKNNSSFNVTSESVERNAMASWSLIALLCMFLLIILVLLILHRYRRFSESYINLPNRHPSKDFKYAKYHDEFIMRG